MKNPPLHLNFPVGYRSRRRASHGRTRLSCSRTGARTGIQRPYAPVDTPNFSGNQHELLRIRRSQPAHYNGTLTSSLRLMTTVAKEKSHDK